jgi:hypothetical protein
MKYIKSNIGHCTQMWILEMTNVKVQNNEHIKKITCTINCKYSILTLYTLETQFVAGI